MKLRNFFKKVGRKKANNSFSILYHAFHSDSTKTCLSNLHSISIKNLESQIIKLKDDYEIISIQDHLSLIRENKKIDKIVSISIDDGYKQSFEDALDLFKSYEIPITYYLNPILCTHNLFWRDKVRLIISNSLQEEFISFLRGKGIYQISQENLYLDSKNPKKVNSKLFECLLDQYFSNVTTPNRLGKLPDYFEIDDLNDLVIGNHSYNHYVLSSLSGEEQKQEIEDAEDFFNRNNLRLSPEFSIPFGNRISYNQETLEVLAELGYKGVLYSSGFQVKPINHFDKTLDHFGMVGMNRFMPQDSPDLLK